MIYTVADIEKQKPVAFTDIPELPSEVIAMYDQNVEQRQAQERTKGLSVKSVDFVFYDRSTGMWLNLSVVAGPENNLPTFKETVENCLRSNSHEAGDLHTAVMRSLCAFAATIARSQVEGDEPKLSHCLCCLLYMTMLTTEPFPNIRVFATMENLNDPNVDIYLWPYHPVLN